MIERFMDLAATDQAVLTRFRREVARVYGERLVRMVLFGSRARGDARPSSDYDVAVFLDRPESAWAELGRLARIETDILLDTGAMISAKPFSAEEYQDRTLLMHAIRQEGREI